MRKWVFSILVTMILFCTVGNSRLIAQGQEKGGQESISSLQSSFLERIGQTKFESVKPEQKTYMIRWNFQEEKDFIYDYTQKMDIRQRPLGTGGPSSAILNAKLIVRSKGKGQADLAFTEPTMKVNMSGRTMKQNMPSFSLKNMNQKGRVGGSGGNVPLQSKIFIKQLFPVPDKKIKKGQTVRIKQKFPLSIQTLQTTAKGYSDITYTGMVKVDGNRCLQLDVNTKVSKLDLPNDKQGEYQVNMSGKSRYYFNLEKEVFQRGVAGIIAGLESRCTSIRFWIKEERSGGKERSFKQGDGS